MIVLEGAGVCIVVCVCVCVVGIELGRSVVVVLRVGKCYNGGIFTLMLERQSLLMCRLHKQIKTASSSHKDSFSICSNTNRMTGTS